MGIMTARIYIAGPISGRPVAEYTRDFREAQAALEAKGWEVVCPLDIPPHDDAFTAMYTHLAEHSPSEWLRALARARVRAR